MGTLQFFSTFFYTLNPSSDKHILLFPYYFYTNTNKIVI